MAILVRFNRDDVTTARQGTIVDATVAQYGTTWGTRWGIIWQRGISGVVGDDIEATRRLDVVRCWTMYSGEVWRMRCQRRQHSGGGCEMEV